MLNISQVILVRTDSNLCRKELTVHWSAPNSLIRSYLQPCTNLMWEDESEAVAPIIWLYQTGDAQKEEVFFSDLLITLRRYALSCPLWRHSNDASPYQIGSFYALLQFFVHVYSNYYALSACLTLCNIHCFSVGINRHNLCSKIANIILLICWKALCSKSILTYCLNLSQVDKV